MTKLLGISGSLREGSFNTMLVKEAIRVFAPDHWQMADLNLPLFNADLETDGQPEAVATLCEQVTWADAVVISTPEYNQSMPGVLKNTIDWLSRPSLDVNNAFRGKPVALMGASPGRFGTVLGQDAWLPVFRGLGARLWNGGRLMISGAGRVFDDSGSIVDADIEERLNRFMQGFINYCEGNETLSLASFESSLFFARHLCSVTNDHRLEYANVLSNLSRVSWMRGDVSDNLYKNLQEVLQIRSSLLLP